MIIKQIDQIDDLLISIDQKLVNNPFYLDINTDLKEDFKNSRGPLRGIIFDLKLNYLTVKYKSDAASAALQSFQPSYNCEVYDMLTRSGAIMVGKTNCDEFAAGSLGVNSVYGPVYYQNCYTGGSSSGAGYTAKLFVDLAFGTDTGGSCRLPALFTRVYGYKPSFGAISRFGIIEYVKSFDTVGVMFKNPGIMIQAFNYLVQHDHKDSMSNSISKIGKTPNLAIIYQDLFNEYEMPILNHLKQMYKYESSNITFNTEVINTIYDNMSCMGIFSECFKFDKLRYHNNKQHTLAELQDYQKARYKYFGNFIINKFIYGALLLSDPELRSKYYQPTLQKISNIILTLNKLTADKILVFPSIFPEIETTEAILKLANLAGLPSIVIPIQDNVRYTEAIPLKYSGVILIGGYGDDMTLLNIADQYYKK